MGAPEHTRRVLQRGTRRTIGLRPRHCGVVDQFEGYERRRFHRRLSPLRTRRIDG